jgi:hypothetical protein
MEHDRFSYDGNLKRATSYRDWRSAFWPPAEEYRLFCLDVARNAPGLGADFAVELESLRGLVDAEWHACKELGSGSRTRLRTAGAIASHLYRIADLLPASDDRRALQLRAHAVEHGYDDAALTALAAIDEEVSFVVGKISTWFGKQTGGLPTAFGCARDPAGRAALAKVAERHGDIADYAHGLHKHLRLGQTPAFAVTRLFFMAGEGNRHPKHIAYFLPEDEGVKYSPLKKTYYFKNTHRALLDSISLPLARRFLDLGRPLATSCDEIDPIPMLGVFAHEMGHSVHREATSYAALNSANRWSSVMLQETAADVFGILVVAEVLAPALGLELADVIMYHLAECLRYVDRGLGFFPDSDGMFLQLNYLVTFGALTLTERRLIGDPEVVLAAFRSLARVLADTLLADDVDRTIALCRSYGPAAHEALDPLIASLREGPQKSIEYLQEPSIARRNHDRGLQ